MKRLAVFSSLAALVLLALFAFMLFHYLQKPRIFSIEPARAGSGQVVRIEGRYLGSMNSQSWISIGGQRLTSSFILDWNERLISFRMPQRIRSGNLVVHQPQGQSNALLLTNTDSLPRASAAPVADSLDFELLDINKAYIWAVQPRGDMDPSILDFYLDGTLLTEQQRFVLPDGRHALYIPLSSMFPSLQDNSTSPTAEDTGAAGQRLSWGRAGDRETGALFTLVPMGTRQRRLYSSGEPEDRPLLYRQEILLDPELSTDVAHLAAELVLHLPLPRVRDRVITLDGSYRGWIQIYALDDSWIELRLVPGRLPESRSPGSIHLSIWGYEEEDPGTAAALPQSQDPGLPDQDPLLLPLLSDYREAALEDPFTAEERSSLQALLRGVRDSHALASSLSGWLAESSYGESRKVHLFVDEMRRRGIAARIRQGLVRRESGSLQLESQSWAEYFSPSHGWIRISRDRLSGREVSGEAGFLTLPLEHPFPVLLGLEGEAVQGGLRVRLVSGSPE